jgi:hypothetical protein
VPVLRSAKDDSFWMTSLKASRSWLETDAYALNPDKADIRKRRTTHRRIVLRVAGCGLRVIGYSMLDSWYRMQASGGWILDVRYRLFDTGHLLSAWDWLNRLRVDRLLFIGSLVWNFIHLDRIYRIIRIILFSYSYILSVLLILSENRKFMLLSFLLD